MIVVEGFDPGVYLTPENPTGVYSFKEFNNSILESNSTSLINLLEGNPQQGIAATYDIVFIDFANGTDDIHRNGLVVEDVIRWVNATKSGNNKLAVLGLSMGGLCARYAITKMEKGGETHNIALFISHGTPEQGAVVPLGFQYFENHLNSLYIKAGIAAPYADFVQFITGYTPTFINASTPNVGKIATLTDAPAAEQMLVNRSNDSYQIDNSIHLAWQKELAALGYPGQAGIRNIAISNGSECGQTQTLAQNGQVLFLDGKAGTTSLLGDLLGMAAFPLLGELTNEHAFFGGKSPAEIACRFIFRQMQPRTAMATRLIPAK